MASGEFLITIAVFVLTVAGFLAAYAAMAQSPGPLRRRVRDVELKIKMSEGTYVTPEQPAVRDVIGWLEQQLPATRLDRPAVAKVAQTLQYAGYYSPAAVRYFTLIRLGLAGAGAVLGYSFAYLTGYSGQPRLLWTVAACCMGYLVPLYRIRSLARTHQVRIRRELPDAIDLMVVCLECGLGLSAAIRMIGAEFERHRRLLGTQMAMVSAELVGGLTLGESFRAMAIRTGVDEVRGVAAIVGQSEKLGSEMSQALRATSEQLRAQRSMRAEEAAQKLPIKMIIPLIAFLLPTMMLIVAGPTAVLMIRAFHQFVAR